MRRRFVLGTIALVIAVALTLLDIKNRGPRPLAPQPPRARDTAAPFSAPVPIAQAPSLSLQGHESSSDDPVAAEIIGQIENSLPARMSAEDVSLNRTGYEARLLIDGLPLEGALLYSERGPNGRLAMSFSPKLPQPISAPPHERRHGPDAEAKAREEAASLRGCEFFSIGEFRLIWFNDTTNVVPAYAIETHYRCERDRKREDWIYRDPDLSRIATLKKRL